MKKTAAKCMAVMILLIVLAFSACRPPFNRANAYGKIREQGYTGTKEEFLASLVGECYADLNADPGESAFAIACTKGYTGSYAEWTQTLTDISNVKQGMPAYRISEENGYKGSLEEWLKEFVDTAEELGTSDGGEKTNYELACEYGFDGDFVQWVISLVSDGSESAQIK